MRLELQWDVNSHGAGIPVGPEFLYLMVSWSWLSCLKRRCRCSICSEVTARERREVTGAGTLGTPICACPTPQQWGRALGTAVPPPFPRGSSCVPVLAARMVPRAGLSPVPLAQHGMEWPRSGSLVPGHWNRLGSSFGVVGTVGRAVPREFLSPAPGGARSSSMPTAMAAAGNNPGIRNPDSSDLPLARKRKGHGGGRAAPQNQCLALKLLPLHRMNLKPLGWGEWGPHKCWGSA